MIIKPRVRGFMCITTHPTGCEANVKEQIDFIKAQSPVSDMPKRVLVIGCSTGYGLAARITAAFGGNAKTLGPCFEKPGTEKSRVLPVGITPLPSTSLPKLKVCMPRALMAMPSLTRSSRKPSTPLKKTWVRLIW